MGRGAVADVPCAAARHSRQRQRDDGSGQHHGMGAQPPGCLESILNRVIRPEAEACRGLFAALLPPAVPPDLVRRWSASVISLCTGPLHGAAFTSRIAELDQADIARRPPHDFLDDVLRAEPRLFGRAGADDSLDGEGPSSRRDTLRPDMS